VTCAAVYPNAPLLEMEAAAWDRVFAVNVRGVMLVSQAVGRRWIERGTRGAIVHLSSGAGRSARRGAAAYCGSKAALNMLVEVLALELGPSGIRVNAVAPGLVMDTIASAESPDQHEYYNLQLRGTPLGRTGAPQDIADAVAFLASDKSAWTTGAILDVSGGSHCGRSHLDYTGDIAVRRDR
jgi:NAD(P)-dependent dehydrogenase (short-subunit alcohol dehydrogenase family)